MCQFVIRYQMAWANMVMDTECGRLLELHEAMLGWALELKERGDRGDDRGLWKTLQKTFNKPFEWLLNAFKRHGKAPAPPAPQPQRLKKTKNGTKKYKKYVFCVQMSGSTKVHQKRSEFEAQKIQLRHTNSKIILVWLWLPYLPNRHR